MAEVMLTNVTKQFGDFATADDITMKLEASTPDLPSEIGPEVELEVARFYHGTTKRNSISSRVSQVEAPEPARARGAHEAGSGDVKIQWQPLSS